MDGGQEIRIGSGMIRSVGRLVWVQEENRVENETVDAPADPAGLPSRRLRRRLGTGRSRRGERKVGE